MTEQPAAPSDEQLMVEMNAGGIDAFRRVYDRYCDRAYAVALAICRDDGRAQEAVQDAFLAVWTNRARYDPQRGTVAAWLLTVVRFRAIDLIRHDRQHAARRASETELEMRISPTDMCQTAINRDDAERMQALLSRLPDSQRKVITLAFYGQLTHAEIATHLGLAPGTVKGRMRLGLQKLRRSSQQNLA